MCMAYNTSKAVVAQLTRSEAGGDSIISASTLLPHVGGNGPIRTVA
jgi:hypothetical protein